MLSFKDYAKMRDNHNLDEAKKTSKPSEDWVEKLGKKFDKDVYKGQYDTVAYGRFDVGKEEDDAHLSKNKGE